MDEFSSRRMMIVSYLFDPDSNFATNLVEDRDPFESPVFHGRMEEQQAITVCSSLVSDRRCTYIFRVNVAIFEGCRLIAPIFPFE